ncbi:MAG TPA: response regulator [Clostridiales bacterium]|jgi:CheY-like chemotaxis protein|nr:response regulator [Clostridiales bacterium]HQP69100.1 response regulator [Clostridiales bacterium]
MADTKKILVVDDEAIMRDLLTDYFEMMDYAVASAKDGSVAWEMLNGYQENGFDLVITDINMPNMGGIELSRLIKSKYPDLPIILMTGYGIEKVKQDVEKAEGFLAKPFELNVLQDLVDKILS